MIEFNKYLNMNTFNIEQGTDEWMLSRMGVITASAAHSIIKKGRSKGSKSEQRKTYMNKLISQIGTRALPDPISFKQAEWGHENEPLARDAFEAKELKIVTQCGFVYKDESLRCGISPDGLLMDERKGLEIKCPYTSEVHADTLLNGTIKPEYITQIQYSMWVTGWESWYFCSFDKRWVGGSDNKLYVTCVDKDTEIMKRFDDEIPEFIHDMDELLKSLGIKFGQQWTKN